MIMIEIQGRLIITGEPMHTASNQWNRAPQLYQLSSEVKYIRHFVAGNLAISLACRLSIRDYKCPPPRGSLSSLAPPWREESERTRLASYVQLIIYTAV